MQTMPRTLQQKANQKFWIAAFYTNTDRFYDVCSDICYFPAHAELCYPILINQTFFWKDLKLIV